jgi:(4S)-4-hydroxy-5-phosphonooxypentane-2,3-dione isomerase
VSKLVIAVDIVTRPGAAEAFAALIGTNAAASRTEPGCRQFDVCTDPAATDKVFLYEIYDDDAAFDAHLHTPHYLEFAAAAKPLIDSIAIRRLRLAGA